MMFYNFKSINNAELMSANHNSNKNRKKALKESKQLKNTKITKKDHNYFKKNNIGDNEFLELVSLACEN